MDPNKQEAITYQILYSEPETEDDNQLEFQLDADGESYEA